MSCRAVGTYHQKNETSLSGWFYPSSHNHGSGKWVLPILVSFMFPFYLRWFSTEPWLWKKGYIPPKRDDNSCSTHHIAYRFAYNATITSNGKWAVLDVYHMKPLFFFRCPNINKKKHTKTPIWDVMDGWKPTLPHVVTLNSHPRSWHRPSRKNLKTNMVWNSSSNMIGV